MKMEAEKPFAEVDDLAVSAIRSLIIDEINTAKSGHPGMALDIAPALYVLYRNHLVSDPAHPTWINRDRFVLSSGHNSALLYAMLHLAGYGLTIDDLKKFRQLDSLTPGHPEYGHTLGVDATAGPLGQGISQAVGMAMAERAVQASYRGDETIMNHFTYCLCGDGCLEEGLSQEAISLAGLHKLDKLVLIYDENGSTLDGPTSNSLVENEKMRFEASNWRVLEVKDGNDLNAIDAALKEARVRMGKPTLIIVHTVIGYGTSLAGNHKCHGSPLGLDEGAKAKEFYHYSYPPFTVPDEVYNLFKNTFAARGEAAYEAWQKAYTTYKNAHPGEIIRFEKAFARKTEDYQIPLPAEFASEASRKTSGRIVAALPSFLPFTLGGSADVASSVMTAIPDDPGFSAEHPEAHNVNFGIREFAMAGAQNGMLLHGGLVTYVGCFLIFSDYMKNAIRMSCLEHIPAIYLFSHDSIAVGEDGPTHEPIEQLTALRTIPGLKVIRPADARETYGAWKLALLSKNVPHAIILSRQTLPLLDHSTVDAVSKGAYIVYPNDKATMQFLATGSEVSLAIEVAKAVKEKGLEAEVVSMPSLELFEEQSEAYKKSVLRLPREKRYSFEMGSGAMWYRYAEHVYSLETFGKSAPEAQVIEAMGFTTAKATEWVLGK
jgi:transketolase